MARLWHGLCGMRRFWSVADGIMAGRKALRNNTFQHVPLLVGIIVVRFDSRWRYQKFARFFGRFSFPDVLFDLTLT